MKQPQIILVTGANGQLGKCIRDIAPLFPHIIFHFADRQQLPLDHFETVKNGLLKINPTVVINTAAYTAVDKAETKTRQAFLINGKAVENLARLCVEAGARLLHVSTDYVFDGNGTRPYLESDPVSPVNTYGASKLEGETLAIAANPSTVVVRTSWVYSQHGGNFVKTMLRLMKERPGINVVSDQTGCPTYAIDLAMALVQMAGSDIWQGGIYHFSNTGPITWFDFASTIQQLSGSQCVVNPIPTIAFPTPAKRPAYSVMDNTKIAQVFGIAQKDWKQSLTECLRQLL